MHQPRVCAMAALQVTEGDGYRNGALHRGAAGQRDLLCRRPTGQGDRLYRWICRCAPTTLQGAEASARFCTASLNYNRVVAGAVRWGWDPQSGTAHLLND
jgi:hypothetical protein